MQRRYDLFLSIDGRDKELALELYDILKSIRPNLNIFLYCHRDAEGLLPLEQEEEWYSAMLRHVANSRHLIFLSSSLEHLKKHNGRLYKEVFHFSDLQSTSDREGRADRTISYFGILSQDINLGELYQLPEVGEGYRGLYNEPEHLFYDPEKPLSALTAKLRAKLEKLFDSESRDDLFSAEFREKTEEYARCRLETDPAFSPTAIDPALLPLFSEETEEGRRTLSVGELEEALRTENCALWGEGGAGKTSLLSYFFHRFLREDSPLIPLYVEAKALCPPRGNYHIPRYLAKTLYGDSTAMDTETLSEKAQRAHMILKQTDTVRYLILVDGYNEIPRSHREDVAEELAKFKDGEYRHSARLLLTSRAEEEDLKELFSFRKVLPLSEATVSDYLAGHALELPVSDRALCEILKTPLYLRLYAEGGAQGAHTKSELIGGFLARQLEKDRACALEHRDGAFFELTLFYLLPFLAHRIVMGTAREKTFSLQKEELSGILGEAKAALTPDCLLEFWGDGYIELLEETEFESTPGKFV